MSGHLPGPAALCSAPELAALHLLEQAVLITERALLAAHPELELPEWSAEAPALAPLTCFADAIILHFAGLEAAVERYRRELRRRQFELPF